MVVTVLHGEGLGEGRDVLETVTEGEPDAVFAGLREGLVETDGELDTETEGELDAVSAGLREELTE